MIIILVKLFQSVDIKKGLEAKSNTESSQELNQNEIILSPKFKEWMLNQVIEKLAPFIP